MNYQINVQVLEDGGYYVYQVPDKIINPERFTVYQDDVTSLDQFCAITRELAVSHDGANWSDWRPLTAEAFNDPEILCKGDIWLRVRFTKKSGSSPMEIISMQIEYTSATPEKKVTVISEYMGLEFCVDPEFNPYKVSEAGAKLESALNAHINKSIGMEVQWFHVVPHLGNADTILNEYSTFKEHGEGGKCIKIMVPENALPDPSLMHDEWGIDFEKFECQIQTEYFKTIWGADEEVRQEDFCYFPKFNKIYYVSSVKVVRGTDGIGQYYSFNMKKYDDNTSVIKSDKTQQILENLTQSHDKNVSPKNQEEGEDLTNIIQNEIKTISQDNLRQYVDLGVTIIDETIFNNGSPISNHQYDMAGGTPGVQSVIYRPQVKLCEDIALTFWMNRNDPTVITDGSLQYYRNLSNYLPFNIVDAKRLDRQRVQITVDKLPKVTGVYTNSFIQQGSTIFLIQQMIDDYTYIINTPDNVVPGSFRIATCEILPSTYTEMQGFFAAFVAGRFIYLILGNAHYKFDTGLADVTGTWMAFLINISQTYSFIQTYVYEIEDRFPDYPGKYSTVLKELSKQSKTIDSAITGFTGTENPLYLSYGNAKITNIRFWKQPIEEELHSLVLNQKEVQNASKTFIIDNADPVYAMDKLGRGVGRFFDETPMNPEEGGEVTGTPR